MQSNGTVIISLHTIEFSMSNRLRVLTFRFNKSKFFIWMVERWNCNLNFTFTFQFALEKIWCSIKKQIYVSISKVGHKAREAACMCLCIPSRKSSGNKPESQDCLAYKRWMPGKGWAPFFSTLAFHSVCTYALFRHEYTFHPFYSFISEIKFLTWNLKIVVELGPLYSPFCQPQR